MKSLTSTEIELINRYLKQEANQADLEQLTKLLDTSFPIHQTNWSNDVSGDFDSDTALEKLHQRFRDENIL